MARGRVRAGAALLLACVAASGGAATAHADPLVQERANLGNAGETINDTSVQIVTALSGDGRYVLFNSGDFCCGDTNHVGDGYLRDRQAGTTTVVTGPTLGGNGNSVAQATDLTPDGRYVLFDSAATNLGPIDGAFAVFDAFVKDRTTGAVEVLDVTDAGAINTNNSYPAYAGSISDDGRFATFVTGAVVDPTQNPGKKGIFLRDRQLHTTRWVADGQVQRSDQGMSGDGRFIAYSAGGQAYVYDVSTQTSELVSRTPSGDPANAGGGTPSISPDGRWLVYTTRSTDIVAGAGGSYTDVIRYDRVTHQSDWVSVPGSFGCPAGIRGNNGGVRISNGGNLVSWQGTGSDLVPNDTNGASDVFVRDMSAGRTSRVNTGLAGEQADVSSAYGNGAAFSLDNSWVGYTSSATNLVADNSDATRSNVIVRNPPSAVDAPAAGPPVVSVDSPWVVEGDSGTTDQVFTLSLSHEVCGADATVRVSTQDGTATTADHDYQAVDQTVTFAPGELSKEVRVAVVGDHAVEDDEAFTLNLSGPSGLTINSTAGTGTGTIYNDDYPPDTPTVETDPSSGVTTTSATLHGMVNPNGHASTYHFEYVSDAQYAQSGFDNASVTPGGDAGDGTTDVPVSEGVTGLTPGTGYHVRVVSDYTDIDDNPAVLYGDETTFTTPNPAATVHTDAPTGVGTTTATFNGTVNPSGNPTSYHYEYVTDAQYQASGFDNPSVTPGGTVGSDGTDHPEAESVTGLTPGTGYHVRVVADYTDASGDTQHVIGNDVTFTTAQPAPDAVLSCAATALRLPLLGLNIANANPADSPCRTDASTLLKLGAITLPGSGGGGLLGGLLKSTLSAGVLQSTTTSTPTSGAATSSVSGLNVNIAGVHVTASAVSTGATVTCVGGAPVLASASHGTLVVNGKTYTDLDTATIPLPLGLGTIYVNREIRSANEVVRRSLEIVQPLLGIDLVIAESRADVHGSRCS